MALIQKIKKLWIDFKKSYTTINKIIATKKRRYKLNLECCSFYKYIYR